MMRGGALWALLKGETMPDLETPQFPFASPSLERRLEELSILYEVSCALQKTLEEERALYTILVGVTSGRGLGFNRAFVLLEESGMLRGRLAIGPSSPEEASRIWRELREKHQSLGEVLGSINEQTINKDLKVNDIVSRFQIPLSQAGHPLVRIMRARQACRCEKGFFQSMQCPADAQTLELLGIGDFAVAPLFLAGKDLGLLIADNAITRAPVELNNLRLLQIYAQQASAALQNTRLYNDLSLQISVCENANLVLRETQASQLQAERLSTIGRMAAVLAHELRTPLVSIGGFARRILRATPTDDPRTEELQIIVSEVVRLEKLIDQVMASTRIIQTEYSPTDINELICSVAAMLKAEIGKAGANIVFQLHTGLPAANADASQLRQALTNLITNSVDAMPAGGVLTLTTSLEEPFVQIGVSDTGMGIAQEDWGKLFTPFFTTKTDGTGLGLTVVHQVVENHRGSLWFDSAPGQGTTFWIRLPLKPEEHVASRASHPTQREIAP